MSTTNQNLREIMQKHGLTRRQTANLLGVSLYTVHAWLARPGTGSFRGCPDMAIKLLNLNTSTGDDSCNT